jgi:uncharacterized membrane protein YphA (DoxX/SURF4 family)
MVRLNVELLLRIGLAFCFLYAGLFGLVNPDDWIGYLPIYVSKILSIDGRTILAIFSVFEIILSFWLLWGRKLDLVAMISFLMLTGITLVNLNIMQVVFRDVGLAMMALALYALARNKLIRRV